MTMPMTKDQAIAALHRAEMGIREAAVREPLWGGGWKYIYPDLRDMPSLIAVREIISRIDDEVWNKAGKCQ